MKSFRVLSFVLLSLVFIPNVNAQSDAGDVRSAILSFFEAMRNADSTMVRHHVHPDIRMQSISETASGEVRIQTGSISRFLQSVASNPKGSLDERLSHFRVELDGVLATAWTGYSFYYNGQLSHCGNNAFQMVRLNGEWKITQVIDTRRSSGCADQADNDASLDTVLDTWHHAASIADFDGFFDVINENGIYLGTDASERWTKTEFEEWARPWFERDSAWDFTVISRNITFSETGTSAWWDEMLDTQMGTARGSGIAELTASGWKINHYHLALPVPNEKLDAFMQLMQED